MKNAVAVTAFMIVSILASGCSSEPSNERLIDSINERTYDFVKVVDAEIHESEQLQSDGMSYYEYIIEYDYTVEFLSSHEDLIAEARIVGNLPRLLMLQELEPFEKGEQRTVTGLRDRFHDLDRGMKLPKPGRDRDKYEYLNMEKGWPIW